MIDDDFCFGSILLFIGFIGCRQWVVDLQEPPATIPHASVPGQTLGGSTLDSNFLTGLDPLRDELPVRIDRPLGNKPLEQTCFVENSDAVSTLIAP